MPSLQFGIFVAALFLWQVLAVSQTQSESHSPWALENSGTTSGLRGINSVDGTVAWASGTGGTVLRTTDGGEHWTRCATPDAEKDGETLDLRGVQAWDAKTAIVMASGVGEQSRLYKTADGCRTWKLAFRNPDKDGFFDAVCFDRSGRGWLLGDPVRGEFTLFRSDDRGRNWTRQVNKGLRVQMGSQGAFAASNSALLVLNGAPIFGSGGSGRAFSYALTQTGICVDCSAESRSLDGRQDRWTRSHVPVGSGTEASGIFSIAARADWPAPSIATHTLMAVGGDYTKSNESPGTAAWSSDGGQHWTATTKPPHGYRSAVQWSQALKLWITVGTNGSDISQDDGRMWQPLDDGNWNALSLPFVVGPGGRIAKLKPMVPATPAR
jgi:photosystem II stability/assembly factor-like uncharacterized protein